MVFTNKITTMEDPAAQEMGQRLRRLREEQGLSLRALERRCGVAASRLSRIENGHVDPRVSTILAILDGLGATLDDLPEPEQHHRNEGGVIRDEGGSVTNRVLHHRSRIRELAAAHGASNPRLFGSAARGTAGPRSDIDLLIDLEPGRTLFDLAALRAELERLLETTVDVVPSAGLEGDARDEVLAEALAL
jgi:predicted nucleotidyltransferase/DNA-binding XRE family transcriptional regulator